MSNPFSFDGLATALEKLSKLSPVFSLSIGFALYLMLPELTKVVPPLWGTLSKFAMIALLLHGSLCTVGMAWSKSIKKLNTRSSNKYVSDLNFKGEFERHVNKMAHRLKNPRAYGANETDIDTITSHQNILRKLNKRGIPSPYFDPTSGKYSRPEFYKYLTHIQPLVLNGQFKDARKAARRYLENK